MTCHFNLSFNGILLLLGFFFTSSVASFFFRLWVIILLLFFQVFDPPREKFAKEKRFYVEIVIQCSISVYEDKIWCLQSFACTSNSRCWKQLLLVYPSVSFCLLILRIKIFGSRNEILHWLHHLSLLWRAWSVLSSQEEPDWPLKVTGNL